MKKRRFMKIAIVVAVLAMVLTQTAFATVWTTNKTFKVPEGQTFVHTIVNTSDRFTQTKTTNVTTCSVQASTMTMWTNPFFKMHNKDKSAAGTEVVIKNVDTPYYATTTIAKNAVAYAAIRSATAQIGDDFIEFKFSADG